MTTKPEKTSVYTKRNSTSMPAPIDVDSDSDFAPGAYIPEPKKKGKRANAKTSSTGRKRGVRRSDILKISGDEISKPERSSRPRAYTGPNPLLQYFAQDLDLHSTSEEEDEEPDHMQDDHECESNSESEDRNQDGQPTVLKTMQGFYRRPEEPVSSILPAPTKAAQTPTNDSATESDSGVEQDLKRKSLTSPQNRFPNKRLKSQQISPCIIPYGNSIPGQETSGNEDSVTESDSEDELLASKPSASPKSGPVTFSDSVTESDSEPEVPANPHLKPRPGFPLAPGQQPLGPLTLDRGADIKVPAAINTYLRDYQRDGVRFFWDKYKEGRGGLLGDDMGKTIQVISFLSAIMRKSGVVSDRHRRRKHVSKLQDRKAWKERRELPPANETWPTCLIIAPSTVVHNWKREFETWGYFEVGMYNGSRKEREPILNDFKMGRLDVVLTTFDLARRDIAILDGLPWTCVIVDEVHRVKNVSAKITVAYQQFQCLRRFGLTGTTIQNSYKEMWTILDWTNPGRLGTSRQWQGFVVKPLTAGQSAGSHEEERAKSMAIALVLKDKLLPHFFLRRTKDIIKSQLPEKTDQVVFCPLTTRQIAAYKNLLNMEPVQNLVHRDHPCPCKSGHTRKSCCHPFVPGDVFRYMSILIKLSNHLGLILPSPNDNPEQTLRNRALAEIAFPDGNIPKYGTAMMQPQYCGKWAVLELLLESWHKDPTSKALIFTKSVKLLEMLEFHLNTKGYGFLKLDGGTKQVDRIPMIDRFHSDPEIFVFLISTLAGGTGLNLTGANKVVIFDPNWNPAHDLQAMDRAFRFGQTRDVSVFRLLGAGSIEELIYARQIYKQQQMAIGYEASVQTRYFEGIQGDITKRGELFGIENIFRLHEDKLATKMAIEKANLAQLDWALANMGGSPSRKQKNTGEDWVAEADAKVPREDGNLRGLGALLFDDAPPPAENKEQDIIQKTLNAIGVTYSHFNDDVLVPSRIEEERTKNTLLKNRRIKRARLSSNQPHKKQASPQPQWPPKRRHHKPPPTPEEQLASRHQALVELGMIDSPSDVPAFARDFTRQSMEMQREIIAELDEWIKTQALNSD